MKFKFVDLFSGIGGFHYGLAQVGGECIMACDIDFWANKSYEKNFGVCPRGDISEIHSSDIPNFEVLCAGFPCQTFSNIGPKTGLNDERGRLINQVFRILYDKKPISFILENVKGLLTHNNGKTFNYIRSNLISLNYNIYYDILEAKNFNLPQIRKRLFIVGIRNDLNVNFNFPKPLKLKKRLSDILGGKTERDFAFTIRIGGRRSGINNKFNWDCYLVDNTPRYITIEECLQLQGFPKNFYLAGNSDKKFQQVGNSVPTTIIKEIGLKLIETNIFFK